MGFQSLWVCCGGGRTLTDQISNSWKIKLNVWNIPLVFRVNWAFSGYHLIVGYTLLTVCIVVISVVTGVFHQSVCSILPAGLAFTERWGGVGVCVCLSVCVRRALMHTALFVRGHPRQPQVIYSTNHCQAPFGEEVFSLPPCFLSLLCCFLRLALNIYEPKNFQQAHSILVFAYWHHHCFCTATVKCRTELTV